MAETPDSRRDGIVNSPSLSIWQVLLDSRAASQALSATRRTSSVKKQPTTSSEGQTTPVTRKGSLISLRSILSSGSEKSAFAELSPIVKRLSLDEAFQKKDEDITEVESEGESDEEDTATETTLGLQKLDREKKQSGTLLAATIAKSWRHRVRHRAYEAWRENTQKAIRENQIVLAVNQAEEVPLYQQGNLEMYSNENLAKREDLANNKKITKLLGAWWESLPKTLAGDLPWFEYVIMNMRMNKSLNAAFDPVDARKTADEDWAIDTGDADATVMKKEQFVSGMFNLVDIWTETAEESEYLDFIDHIRSCVESIHSDFGVRRECMKRRGTGSDPTLLPAVSPRRALDAPKESTRATSTGRSRSISAERRPQRQALPVSKSSLTMPTAASKGKMAAAPGKKPSKPVINALRDGGKKSFSAPVLTIGEPDSPEGKPTNGIPRPGAKAKAPKPKARPVGSNALRAGIVGSSSAPSLEIAANPLGRRAGGAAPGQQRRVAANRLADSPYASSASTRT